MKTPDTDNALPVNNDTEALPVGGAISQEGEGKYVVRLNDGRRMFVNYTVDGDGGFMPVIGFEDE